MFTVPDIYFAIELSLSEISYGFERARAHVRALMTRKSCAVEMRNYLEFVHLCILSRPSVRLSVHPFALFLLTCFLFFLLLFLSLLFFLSLLYLENWLENRRILSAPGFIKHKKNVFFFYFVIVILVYISTRRIKVVVVVSFSA